MEKVMKEYPLLNFESNQLVRDKNGVCIKLWQKLCICYTVVEIMNDEIIKQKKFDSIEACIEHCDKVMMKHAMKLLEVYAEYTPYGLTAEEICSKVEKFENSEKVQEGLDFYEYEFNQIRSQISGSYLSLWKNVKMELEASPLDKILYEFRRKLHNRIRRQKLTKELNESWFPLEWLCFITFALRQETQKIYWGTSGNFKSLLSFSPRESLPSTSAHESNDRNFQFEEKSSDSAFRINDFPSINLPYNTLPRGLGKKSMKLWQRLCVAYTMMEYYRFKQASSIRTIDKADYLQKSFRYYAKKLIQEYHDVIPVGITADMICQCHGETDGNGNRGVTFFNGNKVYRLWTDMTPQINRFGMRAWIEAILPKYRAEDLKNPTKLPVIFAEVRKQWWELSYFSEHPNEVSRKSKSFDPNWFPMEWLAFVCFGPTSQTAYFTAEEMLPTVFNPSSYVHEKKRARIDDEEESEGNPSARDDSCQNTHKHHPDNEQQKKPKLENTGEILNNPLNPLSQLGLPNPLFQQLPQLGLPNPLFQQLPSISTALQSPFSSFPSTYFDAVQNPFFLQQLARTLSQPALPSQLQNQLLLNHLSAQFPSFILNQLPMGASFNNQTSNSPNISQPQALHAQAPPQQVSDVVFNNDQVVSNPVDISVDSEDSNSTYELKSDSKDHSLKERLFVDPSTIPLINIMVDIGDSSTKHQKNDEKLRGKMISMNRMHLDLFAEQNKLKVREMELNKILKLLDVCTIGAFNHHHQQQPLSLQSLGEQIDSKTSEKSPSSTATFPSMQSSAIPTSNEIIFHQKLLQWIQRLESFQV